MRYIKDRGRLTVKYVNADTEDILFEVPNRNYSNIGELMTDHYVTELMKQNVDGVVPENLLVIVVGEYTLSE